MVQRTLFNVWNATLSLWESVVRKRINVQKLKLDIKLNSVLNDQVILLAEIFPSMYIVVNPCFSFL